MNQLQYITLLLREWGIPYDVTQRLYLATREAFPTCFTGFHYVFFSGQVGKSPILRANELALGNIRRLSS